MLAASVTLALGVFYVTGLNALLYGAMLAGREFNWRRFRQKQRDS